MNPSRPCPGDRVMKPTGGRYHVRTGAFLVVSTRQHQPLAGVAKAIDKRCLSSAEDRASSFGEGGAPFRVVAALEGGVAQQAGPFRVLAPA